ncbi:MAG: hypothetical protein FWC22_05750 [Treponema sp.]|nr:hypothetical protein [Treponema sp.]
MKKFYKQKKLQSGFFKMRIPEYMLLEPVFLKDSFHGMEAAAIILSWTDKPKKAKGVSI